MFSDRKIRLAEDAALSSQAVVERLMAYNGDGSFGRGLSLIWERAETLVCEVASELAHEAAAFIAADSPPDVTQQLKDHLQTAARRMFSAPVNEEWVRTIARQGGQVHVAGSATPPVIEAVMQFNIRLAQRIAETFSEDPAFVTACNNTLHKLSCVEIEIMFAQINKATKHEADERRAAEGVNYRGEVQTILEQTLRGSAGLREQTAGTSDAARGMLGKASEVASAAEQSAVAMREAARTAAGLIRAIEEARGEVEVAAGIATRAASQAVDAVTISSALSDHAKAIESILGLIRDIAGQTNLLALNATIEAARAGDAGRGFAVVAQEVKSLANQTARATDEIAAKIAAIQTATRQTVEANGSIRDTVEDVQASAQRIRAAMETQAQTVTMITAAVDETALAADSMSDTIAAIRTDTVGIAGEIDQLAAGFREVDAQLSRLEQATGDFVSRIAA